MKDTLTLNDKSKIELEPGSSLGDLKVLSVTKQDMLSAWDKLTGSNLKSIQIQNGEGTAIGNYADLVLESETSEVLPDGTVSTSFKLREKTEVELLREEMAVVKETQEVHGGAISDLGEAVSNLGEAVSNLPEGGLA